MVGMRINGVSKVTFDNLIRKFLNLIFTFDFLYLRSLVQRFSSDSDPLRPTSDLFRDTVGFFVAKFVKK